MTAIEGDGRIRRKDLSKGRALIACRTLMRAGDFRPTVGAVAKESGVAVRTIFQHFKTVGALHLVALDADTRRAIGDAIFPPGADLAEKAHRSVHAAVFGVVPPPLTMETRS